MRRLNGLTVIAAMASAIIAGPAFADVTIGTTNGVNCLPFGCAATLRSTVYQQVYRADSFAVPTMISSLTFLHSDSTSAATYDGSSFLISFYYSEAGPNALSSNTTANRGQQIGDFGIFTPLGTQQATLTFNGTPFGYDPSRGNLLMDVSIVHTLVGSVNYFDEDTTGRVTSRVIDSNGFPASADAFGLVTRFGTATAVPELPSWMLMICGVGITGLALRRRGSAMRPARI